MLQLIQIIGALAILAAFTLAQLGLLAQQSWSYIGLNSVGARFSPCSRTSSGSGVSSCLKAFGALVSVWALMARARGPSA